MKRNMTKHFKKQGKHLLQRRCIIRETLFTFKLHRTELLSIWRDFFTKQKIHHLLQFIGERKKPAAAEREFTPFADLTHARARPNVIT